MDEARGPGPLTNGLLLFIKEKQPWELDIQHENTTPYIVYLDLKWSDEPMKKEVKV